MAKKVPYNVDFKTIGKLSTIADWLLYISVLIAAITLLIEWKYINDTTGNIQKIINSVSCFLSLLYFGIDILTNYLFQCAEAYRRNDFFDNSLNTILSDQNSEEYFTNDTIKASIYKMGVNGFENSLFTLNIANRYFKRMFVKAVMVLGIFLMVALFGGNMLLTTVLQLALPLTIIQQAIRIFYFKTRIDHIHECFKRIFVMPPGDKQDHLLIHNVTNYEATLAWACIKLPDDIFDKMNSTLSAHWIQLKQRLNIQ